jgi:hypothetical protein
MFRLRTAKLTSEYIDFTNYLMQIFVLSAKADIYKKYKFYVLGLYVGLSGVPLKRVSFDFTHAPVFN